MKFRLSMRHLRALAMVLTAVSLVLVGLGGYVRGTGAGLACPDWPLCFGRIVPESFQNGVAQEVIHRYLASILSVGTLGFSVLAFINRRQYPKLWFLMKLTLGCLVVQIILGGLTVLMRLNPFIVTAHLALGTFFAQVLGLVASDPLPRRTQEGELRSFERTEKPRLPLFRRLVLLFAGLVYFQIVLGGFVGSSGASLVCPDIPFCQGEIIPTNSSGAQLVHMLHRANGVLVLILALTLAVFVRPLSGGRLRKRGHLLGLCFLILLQIGLGFTSVYFQIPVSLAVTHLVLAQVILFGVISYYRRLVPLRSVYFNAQQRMNEVELGEYMPTKRSFVANFR